MLLDSRCVAAAAAAAVTAAGSCCLSCLRELVHVTAITTAPAAAAACRCVLDVLHTIIGHGHDTPERAAALDPPDDFFRVRLVRKGSARILYGGQCKDTVGGGSARILYGGLLGLGFSL